MNDDKILWSRNFVTISLSNFFTFMTFYILAVTLPQFVLELQGSTQGIGLVTTIFIIASVIARPLTGKWVYCMCSSRTIQSYYLFDLFMALHMGLQVRLLLPLNVILYSWIISLICLYHSCTFIVNHVKFYVFSFP